MEDEELRRLFAEMRQENAAEFAAMRQENAAEHAKTRSYVEELHEKALHHAEALNAETRHVTDLRFDHVGHKMDLLADSFLLLHEKLEREAADIRLEMRQGFIDTHALIRFAYRDLDRR